MTEQQTFTISRGEGYGGQPYTVGQVIQRPPYPRYAQYPAWLVVVESGETYYGSDGMSFGVGDESGSVYWATCRAATDAEAAPIIAAAERRAALVQARKDRDAVARDIRARGERPALDNQPVGETVCASLYRGQTYLPAYGGGTWFVIAEEGIWYVEGHSADGDDWSANNLPGNLGWLVPTDPATAKQLHNIDAILSQNA